MHVWAMKKFHNWKDETVAFETMRGVLRSHKEAVEVMVIYNKRLWRTFLVPACHTEGKQLTSLIPDCHFLEVFVQTIRGDGDGQLKAESDKNLAHWLK